MHSIFLVLLSALCVLPILALNPENTGNVTVKCIQRERQALLSLKQGFAGKDMLFSWGDGEKQKDMLLSWGDGEKQKECCNWEGVHCSNETGHVLKLDLHHSADDVITGNTISPALGELHHLIYLDLSFIYFYSSIPPIIASLTYLRHLNLSFCRFQGTVPNELGNLLFLEYLDLQGNFLEGKVPSLLSNLSSLRYMDLSNNWFNGTLPPHLGNLLFLEYLDLSQNEFTGTIPHLGNLLFLEYLDLSRNELTGTIPHHFRNLSNLQYVDLRYYDYSSMPLSSNLQWISHLSSLRHLSLSWVNLTTTNNWQHIVSGLSHLQYLDLRGCNLLDSIHTSLSSVANFSTSLSFVDISHNYLMSSSLIFPWLMNSTGSLSILMMNDNSLKGTIPFGNLSSLEELDFANNMLKGPIPISLFHSCSLSKLDLSKNRLTGQFHEFVQVYSRCPHKFLQSLYLGWNEITGVVPDLSQLSSLQVLFLEGNRLNGTIPEGIGQLSNLIDLNLQSNSLEGFVSEAHFSRLSKLSFLKLSHNALVFNVSTEWVPPFNLININLASCSLGPSFPSWLQTQKNIYTLDISNNEISGTIPNWFWETIQVALRLNLSYNHVRGKIENNPVMLNQALADLIDLSSNLFEGPVPAFLSSWTVVLLSNNTFSTINPLLCANSSKNIRFLDLSNNRLSGVLPECWANLNSLVVLDLSDNYLDGNIPRSMGSLRDIESLHLSGNNFSGEIPLSLINCTKLQVFVAAQNNLSGLLPSWIGDNIPNLLVLSLYSNKFHGRMPFSICNLHQLYVLELSLNNLSGNIPKCISNLSAMATQSNSNAISHDYYLNAIDIDERLVLLVFRDESGVYNDSASLVWKGKMSKYGSTLGLLRSIDFSSNQLMGEIPSEITSLVALVSLNISRNMLIGEIPATIGQLKSLDVLDLSKNQLSERIPSQLSQIAGLSVLNLSYNDLSGEIPIGTQLQARDASAYIGNPKLCGAPLNKTCLVHDRHQINENDAHVDDEFITEGFYIAMGIGFIIGFWGVCCSLILKKSWRYAYFKFFNDIYDKLYVLAAIKMVKLQRIRS